MSVAQLHATFGRRESPATVAKIIKEALPPPLGRRLRSSLIKATTSSVRWVSGGSSMPTVSRGPAYMDHQVAKARELAELFLGGQLPEDDDPDALEAFLAAFNALIGKAPGRNSFKHDRLSRELRRSRTPGLSRRRYDKLFRLAGKLERRLAKLRAEEANLRLVLVSRAALAPDLGLDDLGGHLPTTAFVAYYSARMRSDSKLPMRAQQPFDKLAAALLDLCERDPRTRWYAIAHVFPRADVLARLSDEQKGRLLGRWSGLLREIADRLDAAQARTHIGPETMNLSRGNDSSTWNLLAGAWNRTRDHWIALVGGLGMEGLLDKILPGKVVAVWSPSIRSRGSAVHPDTLVWAELPKPWAVVRGEAICTRAEIEATCRRHGINPAKSGWTRPRAWMGVTEVRPTPELVHGASVNDPYLASFLKNVGTFGGRSGKLNRLRDLLGKLLK